MKGNAKITGTELGYEDHGILTCWLHLSQGSSGQGFGGYGLDQYSKKQKKRVPHRVAGMWIQRILETVGVARWEDLKGKYVRVDGEEWGVIQGIGHITDDKWFYPKEEVKKYFKKEPPNEK